MSINVTLGEVKTQEVKPFPKLMVSSRNPKWEDIVWFFSEGKGVKLSGVSQAPIGEYSEDWSMCMFTDYNDFLTITLQNA